MTITATDAAKTYGQTVALNGYSVSGLLNSDSVDSVSLTSAGTAATANVGTYDIIASSANGSGLSNYSISYAGSNQRYLWTDGCSTGSDSVAAAAPPPRRMSGPTSPPAVITALRRSKLTVNPAMNSKRSS
ncbi:MBG domain-containing protein [Sporomusa ovata]|uniref:MBG domain-containing protein n=1 Tax=Sporomusa ovata TaxID=2378 RepID=UPI0030D0440D